MYVIIGGYHNSYAASCVTLAKNVIHSSAAVCKFCFPKSLYLLLQMSFLFSIAASRLFDAKYTAREIYSSREWTTND